MFQFYLWNPNGPVTYIVEINILEMNSELTNERELINV